jgi:serine/threonine-protein kinase
VSAPETPTEKLARLFAELCDLDRDEQRIRLARLAAEDAALAVDLERMLAADEATRGPIEGLRVEVADSAARRLLGDGLEAPLAPPPRLGPWHLAERLGEGGMGEVWAAERVEGGFKQRAAVKLVRAGMASREVVERFAVERQVLARLEHPAIATLLDGGVAPDGRPWFAMERVDGQPITGYADRRALSIAARLRLFLEVLAAVEFAHRSLVVHRDLKPSNILVDGDGRPKLLDFGLAKLLQPGDAGAGDAQATRTGVRALTPAYAAPEQILDLPITTATDVYSLGVILFELLTGELPHKRRSSTSTTLASDLERETAERPSQRLRRLATGPPGAAGQSRRLEGDLDTIVLKALAREPERRYPTVAALAADVTAHLEGRPISARPDSFRYRAGKFVRRNAFGVAATAVVVAALVAALAISLVQTERANRAAESARLEARRADRVKRFLVSVFEQADPTRTMGAEMPARQILAEGASRLETELGDEPEVRAELYDTVSRIQASLGLLDEGLASAEKAAAERERLFGADSVERARSLTTVGAAWIGKGNLEAAGERFAAALAIFEARGAADSPDYALALAGRAQVRMLSGDIEGASADQARAHAIAEAAWGPDDARTLEALSNLAVIDTEAGTFEEAARKFRGILAALEAREGAESAKVLAVVLNLATALDVSGKSAEALALFERVVAGRRKVYGANHPALAEALVITSIPLSRGGRPEEALAALTEARAIYEPIDHPELGAVDNYTGLVLADLARFAQAERAFERAQARFRLDPQQGPLLGTIALGNEANAVAEQGRLGEALAMFERAAAGLTALGEFDNPRLLRTRINWGAALRRGGRHVEARSTLEAARAVALEKLGPQHQRIADLDVELARLDLAEGGDGRFERARERLASAEALIEGRAMNPAFVRSLAAAKDELAAAER